MKIKLLKFKSQNKTQPTLQYFQLLFCMPPSLLIIAPCSFQGFIVIQWGTICRSEQFRLFSPFVFRVTVPTFHPASWRRGPANSASGFWIDSQTRHWKQRILHGKSQCHFKFYPDQNNLTNTQSVPWDMVCYAELKLDIIGIHLCKVVAVMIFIDHLGDTWPCLHPLWYGTFCCFRPIYPEEELDEENIIEDDAELDLNTMPDTKDEVCIIVNELIANIMPNPSHCKILTRMRCVYFAWSPRSY